MANAYLFTALIPAIFSAALSSPGAGLKAIGSDDEDEMEDYLKSMAGKTLTESLDSIFPIAGQNIAGLYGGYTGDARFSTVGVVPLSSQVLQGARGSAVLAERVLGAFSEDGNEEELSNKDLRDMSIAFTLLTNIPTASIPFTLKRVEKSDPAQELDFEDIFSGVDLPR